MPPAIDTTRSSIEPDSTFSIALAVVVIVLLAAPSAALPLACNVPPLSVIPPLNVFVPVRESVPVPVLVRPADPATTELIVWVPVPVSMVGVAPARVSVLPVNV